MVDKLVRLSASQRSNFVAYLDGELSEEETRGIEQLLASNEVARHDMESLATAWELLDDLPRTNAPKDFAEKTIATLKMEEQVTPLHERLWYQQVTKYGSLLAGVLLVIGCGVAGFLVARTVPPSRADAMLQEYELLEHFDGYEEIGSADFLTRLQKNGEWVKRSSENSEPARQGTTGSF